MANHQVGATATDTCIVDRRHGLAGSAGNAASQLSTPGNYVGINAMRARLTAINAVSFTAARLDAMTTNDMEYALRLNDDPTSI